MDTGGQYVMIYGGKLMQMWRAVNLDILMQVTNPVPLH